MQDDDETQEFGGRPSKSARKREAAAAQDLGTKLIDLKESDLQALDLAEKLLEAILLASRAPRHSMRRSTSDSKPGAHACSPRAPRRSTSS